jgi:translation initiation factor IF-1
MIDLLNLLQKTPKEKVLASDLEASRFMFAGRVLRRFGHARMEVFCHDNVTRQCRIRGLLRRKGQAFIDIDSIVVVSLREPVESGSDDETGLGGGGVDNGKGGDIIGIFDDRQKAVLQKMKVNNRLFTNLDEKGNEVEDIFDRSDLLQEEEAEEEAEHLTKPKGKSQKGAVQNSVKEANLIDGDIDIDDI